MAIRREEMWLDLQECCEKFQQDPSGACGIVDDRLQPVEMRPYRGRPHKKDDVGYYLKFLATGHSSARRISEANGEFERFWARLQHKHSSTETNQDRSFSSVSGTLETGVCDIKNATSDDNSPGEEVTSFYFSTPSSTTSLSSEDDFIIFQPDISNSNGDENCTTVAANKPNSGDKLNNLSKTSSTSSLEENSEQN